MRTLFATLMLVILVGFPIAVTAEEAVNDREFIRFVGGLDAKFKAFRTNECGGYQAVLSAIKVRFEKRTEQDVVAAESNYAYAVTIEVMYEAVRKGTMHYLCLAMVSNSEVSDTNLFVILTPIGDFAIGYDASIGKEEREAAAFTPWSKVDHEGWSFDTLAIADFTNGPSAKVYETMKEVPIVSVTERDPKV